MATATAEVIGRDAELGAIAALLDDTSGDARALLLEGEAGIGKSTLWEWGVERARERGYLVLSCRPAEAEAGVSFRGLSALLGPFLTDVSGELPPPLRLALETALAVVEPSMSLDQLAVSRAVLAAMHSLAAKDPLVLAIDDVQWLDPATEGVLEFSVRRLADTAVRLLVAGRGDAESTPALGLDRALPPDTLETILLAPLSMDDLDRLVRARMNIALSRPRLAELNRVSGGNPYYALEVANRSKDDDTLTVPESLAALLRDRLAELSSAARQAILLTAACPHPTAGTVERAASGYDGLAEAIGQGFLALDGGQLDGSRVRFSHPLLGSVAYDAAPPWERRAAHAALAELSSDAEDRALHLALATEDPDAGIATELDGSASRALRRGAPAAAAVLSFHARRLTPAADSDELLVRTARSAEYHLAAGDTDRGRALLEEVVESCPPGPVRAESLLRLGNVRYLSDDVAAAHVLFERALAESGDDQRLAGRAEQALAFTAMFGGDIPAAIAHARSALEIATLLNEPGLLALALSRIGLMKFLGGGGLLREEFERAIALEASVGDAPLEWMPSFVYAGVCAYADDWETARRIYDQLHNSAVERGDERAIATVLFPMSQLASATGDWPRALRLAHEAVGHSRRSGLRALGANARSAEALARALVGDVPGAREAASEGLQMATEANAPPPTTWLIAVLGFVELSVGNPAGAHQHLAPLAEMVATMGVGEPGVVRFLPDEIESLIALGDLPAAERLLDILEERGRALDRAWALATAGRCRALLSAAAGDFDTARASLESALVEHARLGQPFELGRTLLVQGSIERRAKRRAIARQSLTQALDIFDTLGAALWAEKAAAELARIPGRAASSGELSENERRVAELAAEGLSNNEIAARLYVSVRTVEWNLSKVYAKLGIRSRTGLASRLRPR